MFLLTAGSGFAAVQDSDEVCMAEGGIETETTAPEEISPGVPAYVSALSALARLSVSKGKATATAMINAKSSQSITSAKCTMKIINKGTGKEKVYSGAMRKNSTRYTFSRVYDLPKRGNYYMKATMKCYKDGVLKDTITKNSSLVAY